MFKKMINDNNEIYSGKKDPLKTVFLVWAPHSIRAKNLTEHLDAKLYLISYKFKKKIYSPIKYIKLFINTLLILKKEKPQIIICQSPPIFCALATIIYQYLTSTKCNIAIDMHTGAFDKPWSYLQPLNRWIMKKVYMIIVTNSELKDSVCSDIKRKIIVLEDPLSSFEIERKITHDERLEKNDKFFKIAVISSFAPDEPLEEILDAAATMSEVLFYITGDMSKAAKHLLEKKANNVIFTGFLDYNDYVSLLQSINVIMVLTKRNKTMLAGAYEALALQKPLITSDWPPLRRYFYKGTVHVDNSLKEIQEAIEIVRKRSEEMVRDIGDLRIEKNNEWNKKFTAFKHLLENEKIFKQYQKINVVDNNEETC
jgi:glycosyltransferase involved in cell wall biosynthesis